MIDRASEPEVNFELPFIEGLTIKGQIDLVRRAENTIEDIKTTSDILKYGKTEEELAVDVQCLVYLWASRVHPDLPKSNTFSHLYVQTRGVHKTHRVTVTLTDAEIDKGIAEVKAHAGIMLNHSRGPRKAAPANTSACGAYGGCHLRSICFLDGVFNAPKGDNEMSNFLEMLAKKRKEAQAETQADPETPVESGREGVDRAVAEPTAPEPEPTAPEPEPTAAPEPEPMPPLEALGSGPINPPDGIPDSEEPDPPSKRRGRPSKFPAVTEQFGGGNLGRMKRADMVILYGHLKASVTANGDIQALYSHLDYDPTAKVDGKNIPAGEIRERLSAFVKAIPADLEPVAQEPVVQEPVVQEPVVQEPVVQEPVVQEFAAFEPVSRIISYAEIIAAQAPTVDPLPPQEPVRLIPTPPPTKRDIAFNEGLQEPIPTQAPSRTLYVGCRPRLSAPTHLDAVLQKLRDQLTEARGRHWLCISDYGVTGSKLIAEALAQLDTNDLPPEIYADSRIPGHDEAIAVLANTYNVIERG